MTHKNSQSRKYHPVSVKQAPTIHIPHSSWSRTEQARGRDALIAPDDFWARLGL